MYKSFFFREFVKTRIALVVIVAVVLLVCMAAVIGLAYDVRNSGAVGYFSQRINSQLHPSPIVALGSTLIGVALAASQFVPEATNGRLKLTLHLPLPEPTIIFFLCIFGWLSLAAVALVGILFFALLHSFYLPSDFIVEELSHIAVWAIGSFAAYNFTAAACLEQTTAGRLRWSVAGLIVAVSVWLLSVRFGSLLVFALLLSLFSSAAPFVSAMRFKAGIR